MTRKPLPKAIRQPRADLHAIAAPLSAIDEEAPPRHSTAPRSIVQPKLVANEQPAAAPAPADPRAARRRALAYKIVERHKMFAAIGGLFPLPIVNVASVSAIILRMVRELSRLYQVPFEREQTRAMVISLMGGTVPTGLAATTASTLSFVVPGSTLVGLGVSAISAAALTRGIGLVFVDSFESRAISASGAESRT